MKKSAFLFAILCLIRFGGAVCGQDKAKDFDVKIHIFGDPDKLNPLTSHSADASYIQEQLYSSLLQYEPVKIDLQPFLATARPKITLITEGDWAGGMSLAFEIRKEAVWDNGSPITADDVIFTLKAINNPKTNTAAQRPYLAFVHQVIVDKKNRKKFTVYSRDINFLAESSLGSLLILPEYAYDTAQIMRKFSFKELAAENEALLNKNVDILAFADDFNSEKYARQPEFVVGSGAYKLKNWKFSEYLVLERKKDWWGDKVKNAPLIKAYPTTLTYKIIVDQNVATAQLAAGDLDIMTSIRPAYFAALRQDKAITEKYYLQTPLQFAYTYLGLNTKHAILSDVLVRRALAHLVDKDEIVDNLYEGLASKINGPVSLQKSHCDKSLPDIKLSILAAEKLLDEAGWKDKDEDSIRYKTINGERLKLKLTYKYNQGNPIRKNIGLMLQEEGKKVGIEIEIISREWTAFLEDTKRRDFEIMCLAWIQGPGLDDMKQIWHSSSDTPDGSNRVGFGTAQSDKLIDEIRLTLDEKKRKELYFALQKMIVEAQPYIFICSPMECVAISRRFKEPSFINIRPNYAPHLLQLTK